MNLAERNVMKKAGEHISLNVVEITIKMKTIVRKHLMIKIINLRLWNLHNLDTYPCYDLSSGS